MEEDWEGQKKRKRLENLVLEEEESVSLGTSQEYARTNSIQSSDTLVEWTVPNQGLDSNEGISFHRNFMHSFPRESTLSADVIS
jgi:hypothetical protein